MMSATHKKWKDDMFKKLSLLSLLILSSISFAETPAAVDTKSCHQLIGTEKPFILILQPGDEILTSISACAKAAKLKGASISGIGQFHNPVLAYFTSNPKDKPKLTKFDGYYELASLNGNIAKNENVYFTHIHAVIGNEKLTAIAGHVNTAKIGLTAEITIIPLSSALQRNVDPVSGFGPIITGK